MLGLLKKITIPLSQTVRRGKEPNALTQENHRVQQYLSLITEQVSDSIIGIDKEFTITYINQAAALLFGYSKKELIGRKAFILNAEPFIESLQNELYEKMSRGESFKAIFKSKRKDGSIFDCELKVTPLYNTHKQFTGYIGIQRDITERKNAEKAITESEERYRKLFDGSADGILVADIETKKFIHVNRAFCTMTGYSSDEVLSLSVHDLHPPESLAWVLSEFEAQARGEKTLAHNVPCIKKDGTIFRADINTTMIEINGRKCNVGFFRDITELINKEGALRESEERFRQFFNHAPDYCYMISPEGIIIDVNNSALAALGYDKNELIGKNRTILYPPELLYENKKLFDRWKEMGEISNREIDIVTKKGEKRTVIFNSSPVRDKSGRIIHSISIQRDITDQKRNEKEKAKLELQLQQSRKMEAIGQLAGGIAHDFNNILGGIVGYCDILLMKLDKGKKLSRYTEKIKTSALKASNLTRQLLTFARRTKYDVQSIDVHMIIKQVIQMLKHTIDKRIIITAQLNAESALIEGDKNQIENMLLNIAINARDAMPSGGCLSFTTETEESTSPLPSEDQSPVESGKYLKIIIADTGAGIRPGIREKIFEPFFTTKDIGKGTGLGLSSAYGIIKNHNGRVHVDSEVGKGTRFEVYLPLLALAAPDHTVGKKEQRIAGKETVLLVDDEEDIRESCAEILKNLGYSVVGCENGEGAIDYYQKNGGSVDVILLDLIMPEMNGIDCFKRLKEINPDCKIIIISGYHDYGEEFTAIEQQALAFIEKPFHVSRLSKMMAEVLHT